MAVFNSERSMPPRKTQRPAAGIQLIVRNTEEVLGDLREHRVGLGLVEGHQRSPGIRLEQFMPDEIVPVCATRIPDSKLRRAIESVRSVADLEPLPLICAEPDAEATFGAT